MMRSSVLPVIIVSQFCCTSVWFAGNAVLPGLVNDWHLSPGVIAYAVSAVQLGFITGTLCFALLAITDRFPPSRVFMICSLLAAVANLAIVFNVSGQVPLLVSRFVTGFFLAGIYPVGMKIAADYYQQSLSGRLGLLVGALVLGTAFPHLLRSFSLNVSWRMIIYATSLLAVAGGLAMWLLVPDGPYRKAGQRLRISALKNIFYNRGLRTAAFGYFGHMWELYAFWAFVPFALKTYVQAHPQSGVSSPLYSFLIIGIGSIACALAGLAAKRYGNKRTAAFALAMSGCCCLLSPLAISLNAGGLFILFMLFWGITVVADSPLFSALVAQAAPAEIRGTSITLVTCIGFAITIASIQLLQLLSGIMDPRFLFVILAAGPAAGLFAMLTTKQKGPSVR